MIQAEIQFSLTRLSAAMRRYGVLSGKSEDEVITKQSAKLAWNIYRGLLAIAPPQGSIRAEQTAALKSGTHGVRVRPSVLAATAAKYGALSTLSGQTFMNVRRGRKVVAMATEVEGKSGKKMNLYALAVERELNVRESGRRFSGISVPRPAAASPAPANIVRMVESRYGFELSQYSVRLGAETKHAELRWVSKGGIKQDAIAGLLTPKQQGVLNSAILETISDIGAYIKRKTGEDINAAGLN